MDPHKLTVYIEGKHGSGKTILSEIIKRSFEVGPDKDLVTVMLGGEESAASRVHLDRIEEIQFKAPVEIEIITRTPPRQPIPLSE